MGGGQARLSDAPRSEKPAPPATGKPKGQGKAKAKPKAKAGGLQVMIAENNRFVDDATNTINHATRNAESSDRKFCTSVLMSFLEFSLLGSCDISSGIGQTNLVHMELWTSLKKHGV